MTGKEAFSLSIQELGEKIIAEYNKSHRKLTLASITDMKDIAEKLVGHDTPLLDVKVQFHTSEDIFQTCAALYAKFDTKRFGEGVLIAGSEIPILSIDLFHDPVLEALKDTQTLRGAFDRFIDTGNAILAAQKVRDASGHKFPEDCATMAGLLQELVINNSNLEASDDDSPLLRGVKSTELEDDILVVHGENGKSYLMHVREVSQPEGV